MTYLKTGMEATIFEIFGAGTKGVHEVSSDRRITFGFPRKDGTDICEDTVKHFGN